MRTKKNTIYELVLLNGKPKFLCIENLYNFDTVLHKWQKQKPRKKWFESIKLYGFSKMVEFSAIIVRENVSTSTLLPLKGYFVQNFVAKLPKLKMFKMVYLKKGDDGKPYKCNLEKGSTESLDLDSEFVHKIGKPKRISEKSASKLLRSKKTYPLLLHESGKGYNFEIP